MDGLDIVQDEWGQREGDQGGDAVAAPELRARGMLGSDLRHPPDQHAARPGDRILHLAARRHDRADPGSDPRHIARALLLQLPERGRVDVQALDIDRQLVGPERQAGIDHLRLLRQRALGAHYPPQPVRVTHA